MRNRIIYILSLFFCCSLNAMADASADSINKAAQNPNFIHAYIDIASPGDKVYSCFGHSAIRMTCPSKGLDYCFTFEMDMEKSGAWDFITHKSKAGFAAAPTSEFLKQYKDEGRGVMQYELNLTPKEKQRLWKVLDDEVSQGSYWTFDFYHASCSSMVFWAIICTLDSSRLTFPRIPQCMNGDYGDALDYMAENSPWHGLVWHIISIDGGPDNSECYERMAPRMMSESIPYAIIVSADGKARPFIKGKPEQLLPTVYIDKPCWFRPWMALCVFLVIIVSIILKRKNKSINKPIKTKKV